MKIYVVPVWILLCLISAKSLAQQSVWEGSKEQLLQVKEKGQKKAGAVKKWKDHVTQWGLDTNYNHALSLAARLNTNGWSGGLVYLSQKGAGKQSVWSLYFSEIKHEKETKLERTGTAYNDLGKSKAYVFGKINNAYTIQLGYGGQHMIFPALLEGNMSVSLRYSGGPALALLKPYYLNLIYTDYNPNPISHIQTERYSDANSNKFLESGFILGGASWSKGLGEIKYIPGLFGELSFIIEPGKPIAFVKTVTIGGNVAFYASKIEIMADRKAYPYQASFFVGLDLGKRWK